MGIEGGRSDIDARINDPRIPLYREAQGRSMSVISLGAFDDIYHE